MSASGEAREEPVRDLVGSGRCEESDQPPRWCRPDSRRRPASGRRSRGHTASGCPGRTPPRRAGRPRRPARGPPRSCGRGARRAPSGPRATGTPPPRGRDSGAAIPRHARRDHRPGSGPGNASRSGACAGAASRRSTIRDVSGTTTGEGVMSSRTMRPSAAGSARPARSATRPPREWPTRSSGGGTPRWRAVARTSAASVPRSAPGGSGGEPPWPVRSSVTADSPASRATRPRASVARFRPAPRKPWSRTTARGPAPTRRWARTRVTRGSGRTGPAPSRADAGWPAPRAVLRRRRSARDP